MPWNRATRKDYKRDGRYYESDATDREWAIAEAMLPKQGRPRETALREVLGAIQYVLATGCQWRALPRDFPPYSTVINCFCKWQASDVFDRMMDALRDLARAEAGRKVEPTAAIIDTQSVKTAAVYVEKLFVDSGYAGPKLQDALKELGVSELIEIVLKPKGGVHDCRIASGRIHFHQGLPPNVVLSALSTPVNLVAVDSSSN